MSTPPFTPELKAKLEELLGERRPSAASAGNPPASAVRWRDMEGLRRTLIDKGGAGGASTGINKDVQDELDRITGEIQQIDPGVLAGSLDATNAMIAAQNLNAAMANLNGSAATAALLVSTDDGAAIAGFEIAAWDSEGQGTGQAVKIHGDVLAPGTMAVGALTVGIGSNMLQNSRFRDGMAHWQADINAETTAAVREPGQTWAHASFPTLALHQVGTDTGVTRLRYAPAMNAMDPDDRAVGEACKPEAIYCASGHLSAHLCRVRIRLVFFNAAGVELQGFASDWVGPEASSSTNPDLWPRIHVSGTAPANAAYVAVHFEKEGTAAGSTSSDLFLWKPQIEETHSLAALPSLYTSGAVGLFTGDSLFAGGIQAHHIDVDELSAISGTMGQLTVNNRLTITDSGALLSFKSSPYDESDGLFFGQTGADGFAFSAARTTPSGVRQSVELRDTGFSLLNARHAVSASISPPTVVASTSQTISLPTTGTRILSLVIVGAGGSGRGYNRSNRTFSNGNDGGDTIVSLRDGSVIIQTWTASGGEGGKVGNTWTASSGQSSLLGSGGGPGRLDSWRSGPESYTEYYSGGGGGLGAGGGCGYNGTDNAVAPPGGMAGQGIAIEKYDISGLTNPNLVVSTGLGGARVGESSRGGFSGAGGSGAVSYTVHIGEDIPADVVPLKPTAWGSFVSAATGTFPDLGSGLWTLHMNTSTAGLGLGYVTASPGLEIRIHEVNSVSFVSSQTPTWRSAAAARTVYYEFRAMGSWA